MYWSSLVLYIVLFLLFKAWRMLFKEGLHHVPGPFITKWSNAWKINAVYQGKMPQRNLQLHEKYGPVVRIGPNHVSFASPHALKTIYASRPPYPKSDFYKPTTPVHNGKRLYNLFSIQDVEYHSMLKRRIGSLYTRSAVLNLEPLINQTITLFMKRLEELTAEGPCDVDMSLWLHLFAFDSLGDLNLSKRFGFLQRGKDVNNMINTADRFLHITGLYGQSALLQKLQMRIRARWAKNKSNTLLLYAISQVESRLENPTEGPDMLNNFIKLRAGDAQKVSLDEIAGAMYINLMAGHDVLAVTLRAILYFLARYPNVLERLRKEFADLDRQYDLDRVIPYTVLAELPYLDAVIHEAFRIHANTGLMLERVVPEDGATIDGYRLPAGTIVGVNAWVIHQNKDIFGKDTDVFRPERWTEASPQAVSEMKRFIFSFGDGARKCIGQNIALAQISKVIVEFLRRFNAELVDPGTEWNVHGSWVTKQTKMNMWVSQR